MGIGVRVAFMYWASQKLHKDAIGAGETTSLNRKSCKINDLRGCYFQGKGNSNAFSSSL
jgi:hypothetical protein